MPIKFYFTHFDARSKAVKVGAALYVHPRPITTKCIFKTVIILREMQLEAFLILTDYSKTWSRELCMSHLSRRVPKKTTINEQTQIERITIHNISK